MRSCPVFALALAVSLAACVAPAEGTPATPATVPVAADAPPPAPVLRRGVTEISEGTLRTLYIDRPMVGAKGYVVADWTQGEVRVEVKGFPPSDMGYEVFMFEIDIPTYMGKMFIGGDKSAGVVEEIPPFSEVAGLITQWYSLGDLEMDETGNGRLLFDGDTDLYATGLNMIFIFEKVTPGRHDGPEDVTLLMVECNGPLTGTMGSSGMEKALTVL